MAEVPDLDCILSDCFLAVGQAVGTNRTVDFDVVVWWHHRYQRVFRSALAKGGASWSEDRRRVTAVGRYLGQRAVELSGAATAIDLTTASRASVEVEEGCQLMARREGVLPAARTSPALATL